jgi:ferritin-like metal-binding protein YciE
VKNQNLRELFIKELQDLYDSENQIIKALPRLIRSAQSRALASTLEQHLEISKDQSVQLEDIFNKLGEQATGKKCKGMEGLLKEFEDNLKENMDAEAKDAAIISGAARVHHYEVAGYNSVRTFAHLLGENPAASSLERLLSQEKNATERLSALAEDISVESSQGTDQSWRQAGARSSSNAGQSSHSVSGRDSDHNAPGSKPRRDV